MEGAEWCLTLSEPVLASSTANEVQTGGRPGLPPDDPASVSYGSYFKRNIEWQDNQHWLSPGKCIIPYHVGFDLSRKRVAIGVVDSEGNIVGYSWYGIISYGLDTDCAEQAMRFVHSQFTQYGPFGSLDRIWKFGSFTVETIPFHSKNLKTAQQINTVAYSVGATIASHFPYEMVNYANNWAWKKSVLRDSSVDKMQIRQWCHYRWPTLPEIPHINEHEITRGPRKGQVDFEVNDCYDALCIAYYSLRKNG